MYSKNLLTAICLLALCASCVRVPWRNEPVGDEVNLAFTIEKNLLVISTAAVNGRRGRFAIGSAGPRTVIDATFAHGLVGAGTSTTLQLSEKQSVPVKPLIADLHGAADAILGADVWGRHAITIDYVSALVTYQKGGIHPEGMTLYRFDAEPRINVSVDGRTVPAVVDTASPDTLVLPRGSEKARRGTARVSVAGTDFGNIDVAFGDVAVAHVGNRVLSRFLVTIDYGRREVGLWRDPRTRL
jgi:hypothetical protein